MNTTIAIKSPHTAQPLTVSLVSNVEKANKVDTGHLLNLARQISSADSHIKSGTTGKLKQIHKQIQMLQNQALEALKTAKRDKQLHQAACNIVKKPGQKYYLYEKNLKQKCQYQKKKTPWFDMEKNTMSDRPEAENEEEETVHIDTEDFNEEDNTEAYFSIMSPEDWGKNMPHKYLGGYKLGYDMSFIPIEEIDNYENDLRQIEHVYEKFTSGGTNQIEWKI